MRWIYWNGAYCLKEEARVSPDDRGFLFGDGVYEVTRAYRGRAFEWPLHRARLDRSMKAIALTGTDAIDWDGILPGLLERNEAQEAESIFYLQVTRGAAPRKHAFPQPAVPLSVYAYIQPPPTLAHERADVITLPDQRWARCDIKSISLLGGILAAEEARARQADEAVLVREGYLTEGSHTNVAAVINGAVHTHPLSPRILPGITRHVLLELCHSLGIPVVEEPISEAVWSQVEEAFLLGTVCEIWPINTIDGRPLASASESCITRRLQEAFRHRVAQLAPSERPLHAQGIPS